MTLFDYIVLTILVASIIISVVRGLVREILSLLAWLIAFMVANTWAADFAALLPDRLPEGVIRLIVAFLALFVTTLVVAGLVNMAIGQLIKAAGLTLADRGLGGLFGLARGLVLVLSLVILAGLTDLPGQPFWQDALLSPLAESAVRTIKPMLPPDWASHVNF